MHQLMVDVAEKGLLRLQVKEYASRTGEWFNVPRKILADEAGENWQQLAFASGPAEERCHFRSRLPSQI